MVKPLPLKQINDERERAEKSESKRLATVQEVSERLLARLGLPPQESLVHSQNILREMIEKDPSLREVI